MKTCNCTVIVHAFTNRMIEIIHDWMDEDGQYVRQQLTSYDVPVYAIRAYNPNGFVLEAEAFIFVDDLIGEETIIIPNPNFNG